MCLLYSRYCRHAHNTSDTSFSLCQAILCDIIWVSYNSVKFWQYPELAQTPQVKGSVPQDCPPPHRHFRCQLQVAVLQVTHNFCQTWTKITGSHDPLPLRFDYLLEQLTEFRETLTFTSLLCNKGYDQGYREQPDKEIQKRRSGRVPSTRASGPCGVGVCPLPGMQMCSPTQKLSAQP